MSEDLRRGSWPDESAGRERDGASDAPERWESAKRLFEAALEVPPDDRAAFLERACPDDPALREEVLSLLEFHSEEPLPPERRGGGSEGDPRGDPDDLAVEDLVGATVSHYRIVERLGSGAMGVVYRGVDTRLDRSVAIKFLRPRSGLGDGTDDTLEPRFLSEARSMSALDHPNVGAVHEIDRTEDGRPYIVMAYYEGETLKSRLARGQIGWEEAVDIGLQVARGVGAAHRHGVVHRDIKPANVIITPDGVVKIIDFGIAKAAVRTDLTRTGQTLGTVSYMSPEQAVGQAVDARSDLWSVGVILYEMLTGQLPFDGPHPFAVLHAILHEDQASMTRRAGVPPSLEKIVARCLAKDPEDRFEDADSLEEALERVIEPAGASVPGRPRSRTRAIVPAIVGAVGLAGLAGAFYLGTRGPEPIDSVAVLPFENLSGEPERDYFVGGMQEALINSLAQLEALRVTSRTSTLRYADTDIPLPEIARDLDVDAVLEGAVFPAGETVRISVQLVDGRTDSQIWSAEYDRDLGDVLVLFSEVAEAVADEIEIALTPDESALLAAAPRVDPQLFDLFLRGRAAFGTLSRAGFEQAIRHFEEALRIEPEFARAWAALAGTHLLRAYMGFAPPAEAMALAERAALEAVGLDDRLALGHTAVAWVKLVAVDIDGADAAFRRALDLNPNDVDALHGYGDVLTIRGEGERGLTYVERARDLDPYSPIWGHTVAGHLFMMRRYDEAIAEAERVRARFPEAPILGFRASSHWELGRYDEALADFRALVGDRPELLEAVAAGYEQDGPAGAARAFALAASERAEATGIGSFAAALWWARAGDPDRTLAWLERARSLRAPDLVYVGVRPEFAFLHSDPRFRTFLRELGLEVQESP